MFTLISMLWCQLQFSCMQCCFALLMYMQDLEEVHLAVYCKLYRQSGVVK